MATTCSALLIVNLNFKFLNEVHIFHVLHCPLKVAQGDVLFTYIDERSLKASGPQHRSYLALFSMPTALK